MTKDNGVLSSLLVLFAANISQMIFCKLGVFLGPTPHYLN